ncbi:hypothetical protein AWV79_23940 [Cupriavidus sp. UYMMa02A]|nr:hypothetical protein AWV79_23940 [Cupriavidus sp. UYMMa02A]
MLRIVPGGSVQTSAAYENHLTVGARMSNHHVTDLISIVGPTNVLVGEDTQSFATDYRGVFRGQALAVVRPSSTAEVSAVVAYCCQQTRTRGSVRCDISVPLSSIPSFIRETSAKVMAVAPSTRMVVYGHVGDGNVHFNPLRPADMTPEDYLARHGAAITKLVDDAAMELDVDFRGAWRRHRQTRRVAPRT